MGVDVARRLSRPARTSLDPLLAARPLLVGEFDLTVRALPAWAAKLHSESTSACKREPQHCEGRHSGEHTAVRSAGTNVGQLPSRLVEQSVRLPGHACVGRVQRKGNVALAGGRAGKKQKVALSRGVDICVHEPGVGQNIVRGVP